MELALPRASALTPPPRPPCPSPPAAVPPPTPLRILYNTAPDCLLADTPPAPARGHVDSSQGENQTGPPPLNYVSLSYPGSGVRVHVLAAPTPPGFTPAVQSTSPSPTVSTAVFASASTSATPPVHDGTLATTTPAAITPEGIVSTPETEAAAAATAAAAQVLPMGRYAELKKVHGLAGLRGPQCLRAWAQAVLGGIGHVKVRSERDGGKGGVDIARPHALVG